MRHSTFFILLLVALAAGCTISQTAQRNPGERATEVPFSTLAENDEIATATVALESDPAAQVRISNAAGPTDFPPLSATLSPLIKSQLAKATARIVRHDNPTQAAPAAVQQHVVARGDTLSQIAAEHGVSLAGLLAANDLENPDLLQLGQVIMLPPPPESYSPGFAILPDSLLVRSASAAAFDVADFIAAQGGILASLNGAVITRQADGSGVTEILTASQIVDRVSLEFSVDPRILLAILEYRTSLLSRNDLDDAEQTVPFLSLAPSIDSSIAELVDHLSWLADQLNVGYYGWKYRNRKIVALGDGSRFWYHAELNAGTVAVQTVMAQLSDLASWQVDLSDAGVYALYRRYFGDPFANATATIPQELTQPALTLPFPRGDIWLFTGGFHGGWGNGSAWAAVDFAPPLEADQQFFCYTSSFPVAAVAKGSIVRLGDGVLVLDLDQDGNEGTGWSILYLHISPLETLRLGQVVEAGSTLGYASCLGGYSTATHLHIARRYNGEWIPADCTHCPAAIRVPSFVMSNWQVLGLEHQLYQGYMLNGLDNRSAMAEQGRTSKINEISW